MRMKNIANHILAILFGCTLATSCMNSLLFGFTSYTIFPFSNCLIIGLIWLYRMFDSYLSLCLSFVMLSIILIALVKIIFWKKTFSLVFILYLLDLITVFLLLASSYDLGLNIALILSGIADVFVMALMLLWKRNSIDGSPGDGVVS